MENDLTSIHAWLDKKGLLHYIVFSSDGVCIGNDEWADAGRAVRELRTSFNDEFKALGGKERVDTFLRAVTEHNATRAQPAELWIQTSSLDLGQPYAPAIATDPSGKAVIHDFQF